MKPQPKVRSWTAVDAHSRNSAGAMGGSRRQQNRKGRKASKQALKRGDWS